MRDGWLGEAHAFFDVAGAEAGFFPWQERCWSRAALFESREDAAPRGIGDGVQRVVERRGAWSWGLGIAVKLTVVNMQPIELARFLTGLGARNRNDKSSVEDDHQERWRCARSHSMRVNSR